MRMRYILADIREDAMLASVVRMQHIKYVLPACFLGIMMMFIPIPVLYRIILFVLIPGLTTGVLYLRLDQALARYKKYSAITVRVPENLLKDIIPPQEGDVVIKYESGAQAILLQVESVARELVSDEENDRDVDTWLYALECAHQQDVIILTITDVLKEEKDDILDQMEQKRRARYQNDGELLAKSLEKVSFYRSLRPPTFFYHVLLISWNRNIDLLALVGNISSGIHAAGLSVEIMSAEYAQLFAAAQMTPFGERSSIDEEVKKEPKIVRLVKVWAAAWSDLKSARTNRLVRKKKAVKKEGGE